MKMLSLKLVSGEINRVSPPAQPLPAERAEEAAADESNQRRLLPKKLSLSIISIPLRGPATLRNNQEKQISLFSVDSVPVEKELVYDSARAERVQDFPHS